jgi:8-oxo-dGTP pyrophosphatase MutT (NUDIX family)
VLFRECVGRPPELLMVERAAAMAFAGGAMVFPGGRVDPGDHTLACMLGLDAPVGPAAIAAIRETIEEVGIAVGFSEPIGATALAQLRRRLADGVPFAAALEEAGARLDVGALTPLARWLPRSKETRVFDTFFFVARAPDGAEAYADGGECVLAYWTTATAMLADDDAGRRQILVPTRANLLRLAQFGCFDEARADALAHPIEVISPVIEARDGVRMIRIPEGLGYPVTALPLAPTQPKAPIVNG